MLLISHTASSILALGLFNIITSGIILLGSVGILAALTNLGTVSPEQERNSTASETDESQQGRSPAVIEALVHLLGEENDGGTPEATDTSLGGEGRGGLVLVGVDEVVVCRVVEEDEAEADGEAAQGGTSPGDARVGGPSKDEETDGDGPARDHHGDETDFCGRRTVVLGHELEVVLVHKGRAGGRAEHADGDGNEHEACLAGRVAFALLVDDGKGNEEHVQQAVENAHVHADEKHDEFPKEKLKGSYEEDAKSFAKRSHVEFLLRDVVGLAGGFAQLACPTGQDGRRVRLGHGKGYEHPDDAGEDDLDPVEPTPTLGVG